MENTFPTLLQRDNIKEDVGKWIQFTMNEINKCKTDLAECDTSTESGEDLAKSISDVIKKDLQNWIIFTLALAMKNIAKLVTPKIRAAFTLKGSAFLNWITRSEIVC